jgi:hypothetical protein
MQIKNISALKRMARPAALLLLAGSAVPAATIADLTPAADAIVVGSIESRFESTTDVSFNIVVDRVLKGRSIPTVIHVDHAWQRRNLVYPDRPVTISASFRARQICEGHAAS